MIVLLIPVSTIKNNKVWRFITCTCLSKSINQVNILYERLIFINSSYICTESRKMVPNHTILFHYIYYCNTNSIAFSTLFYIITWNLMLKLSNLCNKYSGNTYALVEIQLNICRNTMDFMCNLEPFSEIRSHIYTQ